MIKMTIADHCFAHQTQCSMVCPKDHHRMTANLCVRYRILSRSHVQCVSLPHTFTEGDISYMHDSMGYHKIGNPSPTVPAVSLHLYCPPFDKCKIWLDPSNASMSSNVNINFFSKYGSMA